MRQAERLGIILEELSAGGSVAVAELSPRLGVSPATIRRDLELLEEQRLLSRTHGGAVAHGVAYELPLRYRTGRHRSAAESTRSQAPRHRRAAKRHATRVPGRLGLHGHVAEAQ